MRLLAAGLLVGVIGAVAVAHAQATCPAVPFEGMCDGAIVRWCDGGADQALDCAASSLCCGWADAQGYGCLPCGPCADACAAEETGCSLEGSHAWSCAAGPGGCRDRAWTPCQGTTCKAGACGAPAPGTGGVACPTSCDEGTQGCANTTTAWVCERPAPGACLRKATSVCTVGEACFEGTCQPTVAAKEDTPAEEGCGAGGPTAGWALAAMALMLAARRGAR